MFARFSIFGWVNGWVMNVVELGLKDLSLPINDNLWIYIYSWLFLSFQKEIISTLNCVPLMFMTGSGRTLQVFLSAPFDTLLDNCQGNGSF